MVFNKLFSVQAELVSSLNYFNYQFLKNNKIFFFCAYLNEISYKKNLQIDIKLTGIFYCYLVINTFLTVL